MLSARERAAVRFAEKLAVDHRKVDDALWVEVKVVGQFCYSAGVPGVRGPAWVVSLSAVAPAGGRSVRQAKVIGTGPPRVARRRTANPRPGRDYEIGINSPSHINFQSQWGVPLAPVVYRFRTGEKK